MRDHDVIGQCFGLTLLGFQFVLKFLQPEDYEKMQQSLAERLKSKVRIEVTPCLLLLLVVVVVVVVVMIQSMLCTYSIAISTQHSLSSIFR